MKNKVLVTNIALIILVVIIAVVPLLFQKNFSGTDSQAVDVISDLQSDYKPWFSPILKPPSAEVESLLFSLQAAIGAGVIGYYFGKKSKKKD